MKIIKNIEEYIESLKEVSGNPELILPKIYRHDPRSDVTEKIVIWPDETLNENIGAFVIPVLFPNDAIYFSPEDMKIIYKVYKSGDLVKSSLYKQESTDDELTLARFFKNLIIEIDIKTSKNVNAVFLPESEVQYLEELL